MTTSKQRTLRQSRALHKYFEMVAQACVDNQVTMRVIIDHLQKYEVYPSKDSIKDIWKAIQKAHLGTSSTTQLKTHQVNEIYEYVNGLWAELGIHEPFPSIESIINGMYDAEEDKN